MKLTLSAVILVLLAGAMSFAQESDANTTMETFTAELDTRVKGLIKEHLFPGFVIGIVKESRPVLIRSYGVRDRETGNLMTGDTIFQLGSVTKSLTGYVLTGMIVDNSIELDQDISLFFPELDRLPVDDTGRTISVLNLATHTSGLPRYPDNLVRGDSDPILGFNSDQLLTGLSNSALVSPIGTQWDYSNFGYGVLAWCMERATGRNYAELLAHYLTGPLDLSDTATILTREQTERLATPYIDEDPYQTTVPWDMGTMTAAGGVYSTAADMCRLLQHWLLMEETVTPQQKRAMGLMRAPFQQAYSESTSYGIGLIVVHNDDPARRVMWHGGDVDGYASVLAINPETGVGVVILTNCGKGEGLGELFMWIITEAAELPPAEVM